MPSSRALALTGLVAVAAGTSVRWRAAGSADPVAVRHKIAIATWRAPREGRLMGRVEIDADPLLDYVAARRDDGAERLTVMHVVGAAAARAFAAVPVANSRVLGGRLVPFPDVSVGFAVDVGRGTDLAPLKIAGADRHTPAELADAVWRGVRALRTGTDRGFRRSGRIAAALPTPLMRPVLAVGSLVLGGLGLPLLGQPGHPLGSVFISNIAAFGVEEVFLAPIPFSRAHVYISLGAITERPVVRDGQVVPVRRLTLCFTGDHRIVDGVQAAMYVNRLRELLAAPEVLDAPQPALAGPPAPPPAGR